MSKELVGIAIVACITTPHRVKKADFYVIQECSHLWLHDRHGQAPAQLPLLHVEQLAEETVHPFGHVVRLSADVGWQQCRDCSGVRVREVQDGHAVLVHLQGHDCHGA